MPGILGGLIGSVSAAATPAGFELIESISLSSSSSLITFSNLSQYHSTYQHLQLRSVSRNTVNTGTGSLIVTLNNDTGNNYTFHEMRGNGTSTSSSGVAPYSSFLTSWNPHGSNAGWGIGIADILDWSSSSKNKTMRSTTTVMSYANLTAMMSGVWMSTAAVTTISIVAEGGNPLASGSIFSLYGLRGTNA